ncbi:MAG: FtsX-like permease family protein [Terriglobia bacterium]|jgi:putative ABC transport system permease protein
MLRLALRNLLRNKRRTILTASSVAVSLFLLSSLAMVYTALGKPFEGEERSPRMMVRRLTGLTFMMPASYRQKIQAVPGVLAVTPMNWFGGYWKEPENSFGNFAVDANVVFDVLDMARIPPDQLAAFKSERVAAVAGRQLIEKFHWKIGDRITLLGSPYGISPELVLRGVFTGGPDDQFYFHYDNLNEAMHEFNQVNLFWIRVERPEIAARVGQAIDRTFRDTDSETKTEAEGAFLLSFISMLGNVRGIILMVGAAVAFAVLLIVANSVAMSIRERVTEAALMRSLGFTSRHVLALFVGESLALTVGGATLGVGGATLLYDAMALRNIGSMVFADMRMRPETILLCMVLAVALAILSAAWPAYRAAKGNIAEALRSVG